MRTAKHDVPKPTSSQFAVLTAAECLALLDPQASWFNDWLSAARPREQVFRYVSQTGLLGDIILRCRNVEGVVIPRLQELPPPTPSQLAPDAPRSQSPQLALRIADVQCVTWRVGCGWHHVGPSCLS